MDLAVALTPAALARDDLADRAVVVIDVLRAGTTIVTALANGARAVIPVAEEGEAGRYRATFDRDVSFIGGERDGNGLPTTQIPIWRNHCWCSAWSFLWVWGGSGQGDGELAPSGCQLRASEGLIPKAVRKFRLKVAACLKPQR